MYAAETFLKRVHQEATNNEYIALAKKHKKWQQKFALLPNIWKDFVGLNEDLFATPNTFIAPKRQIESIGLLKALYADIDDHTHEFRFASVLYFFEEDFFGSRVPWPNAVVETGRGMHLYWLIEPLPPDKLPLWQLTQDLLLDALSDITDYFPQEKVTVDKKVRDATRLLRLPGTLNTKTNTVVKLYQYDIERYSIEEILAEYFSDIDYTKILRTNQVRKEKSSKNNNKSKNNISKLFNSYTLHYSRLLDIAKLQELRDGYCRVDGELVTTGQRELMCFLYRYYSCLFLHDEEEALRQTLEFNKRFVEPLSENEVISATKSAEKAFKEWQETGKCKYNYRNSTLIELLEITEEEQKHLKTIISTNEKYRRKNKKRREERRDETGMTTRERQKLETVKQVKELNQQGLKQTQIAKKLGITQSTVSRILNGKNCYA